MKQQALPQEFADLERFIAWALPTEQQRNAKRWECSMAEIGEFYEAMLEQIDAILGYLNQYALNDMPDDTQRLFHLALALAEVANAVEIYRQPEVINSFHYSRFLPMHECDPDVYRYKSAAPRDRFEDPGPLAAQLERK